MSDFFSNALFGLRLDRVADILEHLQDPTLAVHRRQCTRVRHRRSTCTRCAEACPTHAITLQGPPKVEPAKCIECGICATVCPTGAFEAQAPTNAELLQQIKRRVVDDLCITFACSRFLGSHACSGQVIEVKCLGRLDESIMLGAVVGGAQAVALLEGACANCPHAIGRSVANHVVQRTNALLTAFGKAQRIAFDARGLAQAEPTLNATSDRISRRVFFDHLKHEAMKATAVSVNSIVFGQVIPADADEKLPRGALPKRVPAKHRLLLETLRKLAKPVIAGWNNGIWAQFGFHEKCSGCQMCAFFCPTGALTKTEQEGKRGVAFRLALCTDCRLCQELCYLNTVSLSSKLDLGNVVKDVAESYLMVDAASSVWGLTPEERLQKRLI